MAQDRNTKKNRNWPPNDPPMFWVTFAAFVAVCVYAYFTWQEVQETHTANEIANNAFFAANRPYIMWAGYNPARAIDSAGKPQGWRMSVTFRNAGKTPAIDLVAKVCDPKYRPNRVPPKLDCIISDAGSPTTVIGPDQPLMVAGPPIDDQTFDEIRHGNKVMYLFGQVTYRDKVTNKLWTTRFCHSVGDFSLSQNGGLMQITEIVCDDPKWTCIDENCPPIPGL